MNSSTASIEPTMASKPRSTTRAKAEGAWSVRAATPADLHSIRAWGRHYFGGSRDDGHGYAWQATVDPNSAAGFAAVAEAGDVLVGAGVVHACIPALLHHQCELPELAPYELRDALAIPDIDGFNGPSSMIGWFQLLTVDPAWWGRGIGSALVERRLQWCREHGVKTAAGLSWQRRDGPTSAPLFEAAGFERVARYDCYYESIDDRDWCPDCGSECQCPADLYVKDLESTNPEGPTDG